MCAETLSTIDQPSLALSSNDKHTSIADTSSADLLSAGRFESLALDDMCRPEIAAVAGGHSAYVPHACLANCSSLLGPRICTCPGPDNHMSAPRSPSPSPLFIAAIKAGPSVDVHLAGEDSAVDTADADHHHSAASLLAELEAVKAQLADAQAQLEEKAAMRSELSAAQHASEMEAVRAGHVDAMEALKTSRTAAVDAATHAHTHELRSAHEFFTQQLDAAKQEVHATNAAQKALIDDLKASSAQELNTAREAHARELTDANNVHTQQLEAVNAAHAQALDALRATHDATNARHAEDLATLEAQHAAQLTAVNENHKQELEAVKSSHAHEVAAHADQIRSLQSEADSLRKEIADTYKPQVEELLALKAERRQADDEGNKRTAVKKHGSLTGKLSRSIGDQARKVERDILTLKRKLTSGKKAPSTDADA